MKKIMKKMTLAPAELTIIALGTADVLCTSIEFQTFGRTQSDQNYGYIEDEDSAW